MKMFTKGCVLVALLAVTSVTARPSGDDPKDDEAPRVARTTSYHGANTRMMSLDTKDHHRDIRPGREYSDGDPARTKTEEDRTDHQVNIKITEPVLKHVHEHVPSTPSTQLDDAVIAPMLVTLYDQPPRVNAISQHDAAESRNSPMLSAIRNYENPITSYLKNNPLDGRKGFNNGDNSQIRRQIVHQQTIVEPYSQYYQQPSSQGNLAGYLIVSPTSSPNWGYLQNNNINNQNFGNSPNTAGSNFQNSRPQNGNELTGFQNSLQMQNNEKPVLSQNLQVNSNTLPLVRPSYQHSENNNYNTNSRIGNNIPTYSTFYGAGNPQRQQYNAYRNTENVSPYTGVTFRQNSQNQNYGNLNSNLNNEFTIMQPPSIQFTSQSGVNSYLSSPSYSNYRNWRPSQPINSLEYEQSQNMNEYSQSVNRNTPQIMDGRQLSIPWPFAQYFPIVIKDPLVSMLSGFTSMIEYGPAADVCKPLDNKKEGNPEEPEVAGDTVDSLRASDNEQQEDLKPRAKRLLEVEAQRVKDIAAQNKPNSKSGNGVGLEKQQEKQNDKSKISGNLKEKLDSSTLKSPPAIQSQIQNQGPHTTHRTKVEIARSVELDVGQIFDQSRLLQLGIQAPPPPPVPRPVLFAPQVSESKTVEARVNGREAAPPPKTNPEEPETRNAKDEFEIINVNIPKQDGGLFQGRQDAPEVVDDDDVELINVDRKPGNIPPVAPPKLVPEAKISDDVELIDVSDPKEKKSPMVESLEGKEDFGVEPESSKGSKVPVIHKDPAGKKSSRVESLEAKEDFGVEEERSKGSRVPVINKDQSLSATLEILQDDAKEEGGEDAEKETEDEDEEDEDENSEEEDEIKPDVEILTEPPTTNQTGVSEDPKQEDPGVILTTGSHGNYGPVIRRLVVRKGGVAIAGPGGIATAGPGGVAVVGPGGTAYTRPNGVAIVGPGGKVVGLPNDMVFEHGGVAVLHTDGSEPRFERVTTDKYGLPPGARVLAYGPTVYFHPADLVI